MTRLANKVAMITGASGGIGAAAARRFVAEGAQVLLVDLDEAALRALAGDSAQMHVCVADVSQPEPMAVCVDVAVQRFGGLDIAVLNAGIEGEVKPIPDYDIATFDRVICAEVLEHVPDPEAIINACADLLRPGGLAVFSTLNRSPRAFALAIVAAEHVLGLIPKGTHQFAQFIRPSELSRAVMASGLQLVEMKGLHYNPILKNARLNNDLAVNYFLVARKP